MGHGVKLRYLCSTKKSVWALVVAACQESIPIAASIRGTTPRTVRWPLWNPYGMGTPSTPLGHSTTMERAVAMPVIYCRGQQ